MIATVPPKMAALSMTSGVALGSRAVAGRKVTARKAIASKPRASVAVRASGDRKWNFSAGPAVLPLDVLEDAKEDLINYKGTGMSVMEMSHRGKDFMKIAEEAEADLRELVGIPANYKVRPRPTRAIHPKSIRYFLVTNRLQPPPTRTRRSSRISPLAAPIDRFCSSRAVRPPSSPPSP